MDEREITVTKPSEITKPNPFARYLESSTATSKSTASPTFPSTPFSNDDDDTLSIIGGEPTSISSIIVPSPPSSHVSIRLGVHKAPSVDVPSLSSSLPHGNAFLHEVSHLDLAAAREDFQCCTTLEEKAEFRANLEPAIIKRLRELSHMEAKYQVGKEIAETVDFLKMLHPLNPILEELGNISDKSRQGVIKLLEGKLLVKEAQGLLQSTLNDRLFSTE